MNQKQVNQEKKHQTTFKKKHHLSSVVSIQKKTPKQTAQA
jgi:hypothetical protein